MKNFLTSFIFSICCLLLHAQENRFIYLQTENRQPFFVKFNNKILNSSPSGYLIIPKLNDGLYSLIIGFPGSTDEHEFNCSIKNRDVGFVIKNGDQNQWQLLNVQTLTVIIPGDVITKPVIAYEKVTDPFSTMLANAVHDSTILRKDETSRIFPDKTAGPAQTDSTALSSDSNVALSKTADTDSANKDITKETQSKKVNEVIQKDSFQAQVPKSEPVIAKSEEVLIADSVKSDVTKEVLPEKTTDLTVKDTLSLTNAPAVISKPDEQLNTDSVINKDVAKEASSEKTNQITQKDSIRTEIPQEVIVSNSKKKKSKKNDNALLDSSGTQTEVVKSNPESKNIHDNSADKDIALLRTSIRRKSKKSNKEGLEMMYIDDIGDTKDTIRVLIPAEKKKKKDGEIKQPDDIVSTPVQQDDKPKEIVSDKKNDDYKISKQEKEIIKEAKEPVFISTMINSDCKNFATEEDFLKARKKMVAEKNDEDMIKAAKKIFKTKCFTTEQIKNLSVLFLKDEGRYMFFDAAYPFVSDSDLYSTLEKQLTDNYYITRFRAMVNK